MTASQFGNDSRRDRDIDFSMTLYCPAAGLFLPETPSREQIERVNDTQREEKRSKKNVGAGSNCQPLAA